MQNSILYRVLKSLKQLNNCALKVAAGTADQPFRDLLLTLYNILLTLYSWKSGFDSRYGTVQEEDL